MNLHEYQTKEVLKKYGLNIPDFRVVSDNKYVEKAVEELNITEGVAKIQVHAGGRGKAGGVKLCKTKQDLIAAASSLIGTSFRTGQTAGQELFVEKVLISALIDIKQSYYVAIAVDRVDECPMLMISAEGGIDIEDVVIKHPEKLLKIPGSFYGKFYNFQMHEAAHFLGVSGQLAVSFFALFRKLLTAFIETDASLIEINPLVLDAEGSLVILDAKMSVDDNALYRQKEISAFYDPTQDSPNDVLAREFGINYISLDGNIGCLVNGAGLAMATLDTLEYYGGTAANFLDVGGSASEAQVRSAIGLIISSDKVKVLFVNIFGGIMDCSIVAKGIIAELTDSVNRKIPVVIRMEGTNVELANTILSKSGIEFHSVTSLDEGALLASKLVSKEGI